MKTFSLDKMNILVLGAGAMGSLFGGYLSRHNNVVLLDVAAPVVDAINTNGLVINEKDESTGNYSVKAVTSISQEPSFKADLIVVFVKAMYSKSALDSVKSAITEDTYIMSVQNGSGHEELLSQYVSEDHVLIGTTQHNSAVLAPGVVRHGGSGLTHVGRINGDVTGLDVLAQNFTSCNLETDCKSDLNQLVWEKLFTNISASVLTGVFKSNLGFISQNPNAWALCTELIREAVEVAKADGCNFDFETELEKVRKVSVNSPEGITSICADLRNGRKTEVDTISGSVVRKAKKYGVQAPYHEMVVDIIHAYEAIGRN
ncbi:MAG: ketopantoate reductase family protein [Sphaerochaetaceae bacterium]|nr:ketopantoate reductase family protein [Sphaerochaetaceae bacterium]